jgi:hypothetical protein
VEPLKHKDTIRKSKNEEIGIIEHERCYNPGIKTWVLHFKGQNIYQEFALEEEAILVKRFVENCILAHDWTRRHKKWNRREKRGPVKA